MKQRDMMKAVGAAAGTLAEAATSSAITSSPADAQLAGGSKGNAVVNITPPDADKFI